MEIDFDSIKKDFDYEQTRMAINLLNNYKKNSEVTITEISKLCDASRYCPKFNELKQYLTDLNIIEIIKVVGVAKLAIINKTNLKHFIDELNEYNWIVNNYANKYNSHAWRTYKD